MSLSKVREELTRAAARVDRGEDIAAARVMRRESRKFTVEKLAVKFVKEYSKPRKKTWKEDERILAAYVIPRWGKIPVEEIQPADVRAFVKDVAANNGGAQSTRALACVRKMFSWAVEELILENNPAAGVRAVVKDKRRERVLTPAEIRSFWQGVQESPVPEGISRALRFALVTAMRAGEICAARWVDVEEGRWLNVPHTKSNRSHKVYLSGPALEVMGDVPEDEEEKKNLIFNKPDGAPIINYDLSMHVRRHLKEWGAKSRWTPHDLRRTAATLMSEAGVDRLVLGKILNHADQSTTAIYDRAGYWNDMRRAWELWARRLRRILTGQSAGKVVRIR